jgi:hypothetical protein
MFARLAVKAAKPAGTRIGAAFSQRRSRALQVRFNTSHALARGGKGRDMPPMKYRTPTLPNASRPARATFTIRVSVALAFVLFKAGRVQTNGSS